MNITIGNSNSNVRHTTTRLIAGAAAAALALSAIAGLSGTHNRSDAATPSARSVVAFAAHNSGQLSPLRLVLVDSVGQQQQLQAQFAADEHLVAATGEMPQSSPIVLVKGSAIEQSLVAASSDVASSGRNVEITDLSLPAKNAAPVASPQFSTAVDAEYAARSLVAIPELVGSKDVQPMFGTAADAEYAAQSLR